MLDEVAMIRRRGTYRKHDDFDYALFSRLCALGLSAVTAYFVSKVSNLYRLFRRLEGDNALMLQYAIAGWLDAERSTRGKLRAYLGRPWVDEPPAHVCG